MLAHVFLLFQFENMLIEFLLELLIGIVDAELLERILGEMFEAINIEDANKGLGTRKDCIRG